jgi:hypothetical protein
MKIRHILVALAIGLAGCTHSGLEFKKEPLTGEEYGVARYPLLSVKNSESASISLKCTREDSGKKVPIQANLCIIQKIRKYKINVHETLKLYIDGVPYTITEVNSIQDPLETPEHYAVYLPSGGRVGFGTIQEITKKQLSFLISQDHFSKMVAAKRIVFELSSGQSSQQNSLEYPIIVEFGQENISFLQEFKHKCVNNFLNQ